MDTYARLHDMLMCGFYVLALFLGAYLLACGLNALWERFFLSRR